MNARWRHCEPSTSELRSLPAIETLRQVWIQNFVMTDGQIHWRENDNTPPAGRYIIERGIKI